MGNEMLKLHRNLLVCPGERSCGECIKYVPGLAMGDVMVPKLRTERDPAVDMAVKECPSTAMCLYLVVP